VKNLNGVFVTPENGPRKMDFTHKYSLMRVFYGFYHGNIDTGAGDFVIKGISMMDIME
jgi:hypothetical protein